MNIIDAVKRLVSDWQTRSEIRRTRREWARSEVHKFRGPGIEALGRVAGEVKAMDERLAKLNARGRSKR